MIERIKKFWADVMEAQRIVSSMEGAPGPLGHYFPFKNCEKNHGMVKYKTLFSGRYEYGYCSKCQQFRYLTYL